MRVLVTGGAGFVGSHIADRLVADGHEVLVVDDLSTGQRRNVPGGAQLVELDITDPALSDVVLDFRPDAVSHCAAQISVVLSTSDPGLDARINIVGGINVCQAAIMAGCSQMVYLSTGGVLYGNPDYLPCDEDHPLRPISAYAMSKWTLERYLQLLLPATVQLKVLRLANVYGPRQTGHGGAGVVTIFGKRMVSGDEVLVHGDGEQTKDYIYVADVVRAHQLGLETQGPFIVNVGTGQPTSVNTLFELMAGHAGYAVPPVHVDPRPGDVKHIYLDSSRAKRLLGWTPQVSLKDGLRETLDWIREARK